MTDWYLKSETGPLRDVLLGPVDSFYWLGLENAEYSSLVRDSLRRGRVYDADLARRQHAEMVQAYESAGTTCHFLPVDEGTPMQVYARDSSFMTPYGAVICQLANPRRRGEYAPALRFYLENNVPIYDMVSMGNFEGGDFNIIKPGVALVGYTDHRSEGVAAKQLAQWFIDEGWEIKFAPIDPFYVHIDLMVCMLTEHCAAVCLETTDPEIVSWLRNMNIEVHARGNRPQPENARHRARSLRSGHDHVHLGRRRRALHVSAVTQGSRLIRGASEPTYAGQ
jgi:N-dimethylarginine dimethylaminohydrolase